MFNGSQVIQTNSSLLSYWLEDYWNKYGDQRIANWPLMSSFGPALIVLTAYAAFVLVLGPKWMNPRKAFDLKSTLIVYNLVMALFNGYIFIVATLEYQGLFVKILETKFPRLDLVEPFEMKIIKFNYLFVCSKFVDLLDTVFFVLRKKNCQITGLHFYHHLSIPFFGWMYFRLCASCYTLIPFGWINSLVHMLMYSYYGLSALGPNYRRYLWWKPHLTLLQIVQFCILFLYGVYFLSIQQNYPMVYILNQLIQISIYLVLFSRFYLRTYRNKNKIN